jgi:predicted ABC-type ATPase
MARVQRRVALGGHPVPLDRIPGRYARNLEHLAMAIPLVDEADVWDNSSEDQAPAVIVEFQNGKVTTRVPSLPAWVTKALGPLLEEPKPKRSKRDAAPPRSTQRRLR